LKISLHPAIIAFHFKNMRGKKVLVSTLVLTFLINMLDHFVQPVLFYDEFPLADGNEYFKIYEYFRGEREEFAVKFPFNSRVLIPWLASFFHLKSDLLNFKVVNLIFSLLSVYALYTLWKKLGIASYLMLLAFGWLLIHWTGMLRLNIFDPVTVDLPLYFFPVLLMLLVMKRRFQWLLLLAPVATLQKESFIPLLLVLLLYAWAHNLFSRRHEYPLSVLVLALALSIAAKIWAVYNFPPIESGRSSVITVLFHLKELLLHPFKLIRWIAAFVVAFGFFPFLAARYWKNYEWNSNYNLLALFSLASLAMSIVGGDDYTRLIFLSFPFLMTLMLLFLQHAPKKSVIFLFLLSLPLTRFWQQIPDPAFKLEQWKKWYPEYADWPWVLIYAGCGIFFYFSQKLFLKS
jgi:hypothetical protein